MPIKGLTDRSRNNGWPILGKLKKGTPKDAQGRMGKELPHFRFMSERPEVEAAFRKAYGDKVASIEVVLPYAHPDDVFTTWQEERNAKGLIHRCDGETMVQYIAGNGYSFEPKPCPYFTGEKVRTTGKGGNPGCVKIGRLHVVLPELLRAGFAGVVVVETHAINDMTHIAGMLQAASDFGSLAGVKATVYRKQQVIGTPNFSGEGRATAPKWLVKIALDPAFIARIAEQMMAASNALAGGESYAMLTDGRAVDTVTGEILDNEDDEDDDEDAAPEVDKTALLKTMSARIKNLPVNYGNFGDGVKKAYDVASAADLSVADIKDINAKIDAIYEIALLATEMYRGAQMDEHVGWLTAFLPFKHHPVEATIERLQAALTATKEVESQAQAA